MKLETTLGYADHRDFTLHFDYESLKHIVNALNLYQKHYKPSPTLNIAQYELTALLKMYEQYIHMEEIK
jgi:hypothetical protein